MSLDNLLADLASRNLNPHQTVSRINTVLPDDAQHRELILSASLSNGSDPLLALAGTNGIDVQQNTIIMLYILNARCSLFLPQGSQGQGNVVPPPTWGSIEAWTQNFDADRARACPRDVTKLARCITALAARSGNTKNAITPLLHILQRYAPRADILTTVHIQFLYSCASSKSFASALPVLSTPIQGVGPSTGLTHTAYPSVDLTYQDVLLYHYLGGFILTALHRWSEAEEYFEAAVLHPGSAVSAIQFEALKKLRLVQLIGRGEAPPLPKQAHPGLNRPFRSTPYHAFVQHYPSQTTVLKALVDGTQHFGDGERGMWQSDRNSRDVFSSDQNYGLVQEAFRQAPKWQLKKLTNTYVTLGVGEIGKHLGISDEAQVLSLVIGMIETKLINASISYDAAGQAAVRFDDDEVHVSKAQVDALLRSSQIEAEFLQHLDEETSSSKEYLTKAVKARNNESDMGGAGGFGVGLMDEDIWESDLMHTF
ncbi:hypothetical protein DL96DRAFT_1596566 [Flagelloscypha sp. PMI_526]|nr:hypothetical protein DL96DRAFT_1596566 [Flagelloscypha sp. PMI_526]